MPGAHMTKTTTIAVSAVGAVLLLGGSGAVVSQLGSSAEATAVTTTSALGAPPVKIVSVGPDTVKVDVGPSQPGPFTPSLAKARSLKISWPPSKDDFHPTGMIYSVQKNGKVINAALVNNYITVGFTAAVRSFRFCVKAINSAGYNSPLGCATFSGH
jgi:hypothetical protein